jgi:hypothetical protein
MTLAVSEGLIDSVDHKTEFDDLPVSPEQGVGSS